MSKQQSKFPRAEQHQFCRDLLNASDPYAFIRAYSKRFAPSPGFGWREAMERVGNYPIITMDGNSKLPFASFSALPIYTCPGAGDCVKWCYSLKAWQYPGAFMRQIQNTLLIRAQSIRITQAFLALPEGATFRLYVDGDFDSVETAQFWFGLLELRPDVKVYGYSKSWDILNGLELPANYFLNLSSGARDGQVKPTGPQVRGEFLAVPIHYKGKGFKRYQDKTYHDAVRAAAPVKGFSCPGQCGSCANGTPACANPKFIGIPIYIGVH